MNPQELQSLYESYLEVYQVDEELTGARKERANAIAGEKSIPNSQLHRETEIKKKRSQAKWLAGRSSSGKEHPSQGFGSHPDPKKSRAPKNTIANSRTSPGIKKRKLSTFAFNKAGGTNLKTGSENVAGHGMPQVDTLPRGKGSKAARRAAALKNESYDLYDIILSHLLDEGYAETQQAAEVIMVNMSEEWRESIVEAEVEPPKERLKTDRNMFSIPKDEREKARERALAKAKAMREKKK